LARSGNQYDRAVVDQYLSDDLDNAALRSLMRQAIGDAKDPHTKAERIRTFVAERCTYTLDAPQIPRGEDVTVHFLNVTQQGYCDLYATAVAVLCRYAGLPARVATGFVPGTPSALNAREWVLTGNDRHAWAEVYFAGYGWVPFDATAVTSTSGLTEAQEARAERNDWWRRLTARGPIPLVLSALALLILVGVIVTELAARFGPLRRRAAPGRTEAGAFAAPSDTNAWAAQIHRLYANTARAVGKRGGIGARQPATTPRAYVALARARIGETVAEPLRRLTDLAELALYGPTTLTERHVTDARVLAKAVRAALKKVPRPRPRWWPWSLRFARADAADTSPQGAVHALPRR
jgi:hypothetical protein